MSGTTCVPAAVAGGLLLLGLAGCRAHGPEADESAGEVAGWCDPLESADPGEGGSEGRHGSGAGEAAPPRGRTDGARQDTVTARALAGKWRIVLSATEGPRAGAETRGTLWLDPYREEAPMAALADSLTSVPLYGSAELDLAEVGALELGGTSSRDPDRPGVLVFHRRAGGEEEAGIREELEGGSLLMRLGEDANRADRVRFDGGFTVLRVEERRPRRLAGRWESGTREAEAAGRFCALREDGSPSGSPSGSRGAGRATAAPGSRPRAAAESQR